MAGPIAGTMDNIGAFIAIGIFAGILNSLFYSQVYNKINQYNIFDTYGILFIFIVSLLATVFIQPIVLKGMIENSIQSNLLNNNRLENTNISGWSLTYIGISIAIALLSGLLTGFVINVFGKEDKK